MSMPTTPPTRHPRHALNLPAGSVRALLALMVLVAMWLVGLFGNRAPGETVALTEKVPVAYIYLQYVMILILAHYFAAHGSTIGKQVSTRGPLGLPDGSIRFLLLAGYIGLIVWLFYNRREFEAPETAPIVLPMVLLLAFCVGYIMTRIVRSIYAGILPYWFQDVQAWTALMGTLGLLIITVIRLFIYPTINQDLRVSLTTLETIIAAFIGFYFGARS